MPTDTTLNSKDPIQIVPYRGFGNSTTFFLRGRVLEDKKIGLSTDKDSAWRNLQNAWKRFESDEIGGARVRVSKDGIYQEVTTDSEGFFAVTLETPQPVANQNFWQELDVELLSPLHPPQGAVKEKGQVLVPTELARFGVISDMDDTVLQTNAASILQMAKNVLFGNARTRLPFKGVAAFYQALQEEDGEPANPLYYVSSSPWNLYDLLMEFFQIQKIPIGPLLLKDWGITGIEALPQRHRAHKLNSIRQILDLVTDLPFILIGDSGQKDPEIYHEILSLYPKRILAIYIRNVSRGIRRASAIRELAKKVVDEGSTLILADDTLAAARHAIEQGWIKPDKFPEIVAEKNADESPKKKLLKPEPPSPIKISGKPQKNTARQSRNDKEPL